MTPSEIRPARVDPRAGAPLSSSDGARSIARSPSKRPPHFAAGSVHGARIPRNFPSQQPVPRDARRAVRCNPADRRASGESADRSPSGGGLSGSSMPTRCGAAAGALVTAPLSFGVQQHDSTVGGLRVSDGILLSRVAGLLVAQSPHGSLQNRHSYASGLIAAGATSWSCGEGRPPTSPAWGSVPDHLCRCSAWPIARVRGLLRPGCRRAPTD